MSLSIREMYGSRDERLKFASGNVDISDFLFFDGVARSNGYCCCRWGL